MDGSKVLVTFNAFFILPQKPKGVVFLRNDRYENCEEIEEYGKKKNSKLKEKFNSKTMIFFLRWFLLKVSLLVDGKEIKINEFVEDFFGRTLQGAISTLKEVNRNWKELDIKLKR